MDFGSDYANRHSFDNIPLTFTMNPNVMHQMYQKRFPTRFVSKGLAVQWVAARPGPRRPRGSPGRSVTGWRAWRALEAAEGQPVEIRGSHSVTKISY